MQQHAFEMAAVLTREYAERTRARRRRKSCSRNCSRSCKRFVQEKVTVETDAKRVDVFLAPYWGYAIERLKEELHRTRARARTGDPPVRGRRPSIGSTAEVDFWTSKKVREVQKSHLNYVVQDSKWEQSAAYHLDNHPRVYRS